MIYEDQLAAIERDSRHSWDYGRRFRPGPVDRRSEGRTRAGNHDRCGLPLFFDSQAEIHHCRFPGHEQYTRNMATGASNCDLAIILIDARHGVLTQTKRHCFIVSLLGIKHVIVAINKMDLVDYSEEVFEQIKADYRRLRHSTRYERSTFHPTLRPQGRQCR